MNKKGNGAINRFLLKKRNIGILVTKLDCNSDLGQVGSAVKEGAVVLYPTDTVYGLGSNPFSVKGVLRCIEIKKRDSRKQMPVLVASLEDAAGLVYFNRSAQLVAKKYWPGKLTIVLPCKNPSLVPELIGETRTIGVRLPDHVCSKKLIAESGGCLVGTSANISGEPPINDKEDRKLQTLAQNCDYLILGDCGDGKLSSTVLDLTNEISPSIIRAGAISGDEILDYLANIKSNDLSFRATKRLFRESVEGKE